MTDLDHGPTVLHKVIYGKPHLVSSIYVTDVDVTSDFLFTLNRSEHSFSLPFPFVLDLSTTTITSTSSRYPTSYSEAFLNQER